MRKTGLNTNRASEIYAWVKPSGTHRKVCDENQNKRSNDRCIY